MPSLTPRLRESLDPPIAEFKSRKGEHQRRIPVVTSVDLYFGPTAPKGFERNWIPTVPGKAWFPYFRLYAPTEDHFNRKWILPDFEKVQ